MAGWNWSVISSNNSSLYEQTKSSTLKKGSDSLWSGTYTNFYFSDDVSLKSADLSNPIFTYDEYSNLGEASQLNNTTAIYRVQFSIKLERGSISSTRDVAWGINDITIKAPYRIANGDAGRWSTTIRASDTNSGDIGTIFQDWDTNHTITVDMDLDGSHIFGFNGDSPILQEGWLGSLNCHARVTSGVGNTTQSATLRISNVRTSLMLNPTCCWFYYKNLDGTINGRDEIYGENFGDTTQLRTSLSTILTNHQNLKKWHKEEGNTSEGDYALGAEFYKSYLLMSGAKDEYFNPVIEEYCTVRYYNDNNSLIISNTKENGEKFYFDLSTYQNNLIKTNYVFKGWTNRSDCKDYDLRTTYQSQYSDYYFILSNYLNTTTVQESKMSGSSTQLGARYIDLYPVYAKAYQVIFYNSDGSVLDNTSNNNKIVGDSVTLPSTSPSKTGYTFLGWIRTPDSGQYWKEVFSGTVNDYTVPFIADNQAGTNSNEIKYYPVFKKKYYIIFKNEDGTNLDDTSNINKYVGDSVTLPSTSPSKTGYTFLGWTRSPDSEQYWKKVFSGTASGYTVPSVADNQVNGEATSSGFKIYYYPVFKKLYKVIFYNESGNVLQTFDSTELNDSITYSGSTQSKTGYEFLGWTRTPDSEQYWKKVFSGTANDYTVSNVADDQINGQETSTGFEIKYYTVFKKLYQIIFDANLSNSTFSYDQSNYNQKVVGDSLIKPTAPTINTHQFLGWTLNSSNSTWVSSLIEGQDYWNISDLPSVNDSQASNTANINGFEIKYYGVWRIRDKVIISANVSATTSDDTISFVSTPSAKSISSYSLTYYFDEGLSKKVTISRVSSATSFYLASVTGATGSISSNYTSWTGNDVQAGVNGTTTRITLTYYKNLLLEVFLYQTENSLVHNSDKPTYSTNKTLAGWGSDYGPNNASSKAFFSCYLNPNESITFTTSHPSDDFYIDYIYEPYNTNTMTKWTWSTEDTFPAGMAGISRTLARSYNSDPNAHVKITDNACKQLTYTFSATLNHMTTSTTTNKEQYVYVIYRPFYCQFLFTNTGYTSPTYTVSSDLTLGQHYSLVTSGTTKKYSFYNDITVPSTATITVKRNNNSSKYVISQVSLEGTTYDTKYSTLKNGSSSLLNNYFYLSDSVVQNGYYLNKFLSYTIKINQNLINSYNAIRNINVTWSNKDYKCFIILKLSEANEDADTSITNTTTITDVININAPNFSIFNDTSGNKNRKNYIREITNTSTTNTLGATFYDQENKGYVLKNIQKFSYNGNYNSSLNNSGLITRVTLDSSSNLPDNWPTELERTSSDVFNDKIELVRNNLSSSPGNGAVDYYFITYEEGLPIFYPDSSNQLKRAIQMYWEDDRVIGLYYENIKLL